MLLLVETLIQLRILLVNELSLRIQPILLLLLLQLISELLVLAALVHALANCDDDGNYNKVEKYLGENSHALFFTLRRCIVLLQRFSRNQLLDVHHSFGYILVSRWHSQECFLCGCESLQQI